MIIFLYELIILCIFCKKDLLYNINNSMVWLITSKRHYMERRWCISIRFDDQLPDIVLLSIIKGGIIF